MEVRKGVKKYWKATILIFDTFLFFHFLVISFYKGKKRKKITILVVQN